jgi:hypothetical protein
MIFRGGIKIFLLLYFCYYICFYPYAWDPHVIEIHIKSLPTLSYHFIHQHLLSHSQGTFSSVGRQQEMDGGEGTRVEARWGRPAPPPDGRPPPLALYKQPPPTQFFAHTPAQKTSPSSLCSAATRERKLRKGAEKKSKGSLALIFSLAPLKALDTMFGRIEGPDWRPERGEWMGADKNSFSKELDLYPNRNSECYTRTSGSIHKPLSRP